MLEKIGVHRKDPFRMECSCGVGNASAFCVSGPLLQGWFGHHVSERRKRVDVTTDSIRPQLDAWWGTEGSNCVLDASPVEVYDSIVDWQSYLEYKKKNLLDGRAKKTHGADGYPTHDILGNQEILEEQQFFHTHGCDTTRVGRMREGVGPMATVVGIVQPLAWLFL
eukprot:jgi/Picre1/32611/NNA_007957.t1